MTTTQKTAVAAIIALAACITIYQMQKGPEAAREKKAGQSMSSAVSRDIASSRASGGAAEKSGPQYLLKPRLDEARKRQLQQNPGGALMALSKRGENWSHEDDDLLVVWAAQDPEAAMKWVKDGGGAVLAQNLGAVAAGILLRDGKDAMRRFLDAHQQDPELRPKDQGDLEKYLFYHLGREDTFDAAMEILREKKDGSLAGSMITGIEGAQFQTNAIDYMESKGIPVDFNYWSLQGQISNEPRFWADWALQRNSDLLPEIVDSWARGNTDEAKAWVAERVPKDDKRRAKIDERLQLRENPPVTDQPE